MYQFQPSIYPLNSNVPMHAPVNLSSPLVKLIVSLDLTFLIAVRLSRSQRLFNVIKEKTSIIQDYSLSNTS